MERRLEITIMLARDFRSFLKQVMGMCRFS